jgi:hypothetical protein
MPTLLADLHPSAGATAPQPDFELPVSIEESDPSSNFLPNHPLPKGLPSPATGQRLLPDTLATLYPDEHGINNA